MHSIYSSLENQWLTSYSSNEISALHVVKTYCLRTMLYVTLGRYQTITYIKLTLYGTTALGEYFHAAKVSTCPLQFFCESLPLYLMLDQRKLMLWFKIQCSDNIVLCTMTVLNHNEFVAVSSKYAINVCNIYLNVSLNRVFGLHFVTLWYFNMDVLFCVFLCLCCVIF